jgi:hypothetical protein
MPLGICKLCREEKELVNSHFIPAGAFKALHASGLEVNEPMVLTEKRIIQSSRQITSHAFCGNCEDRFNRGGEAWTLDKLATLTAFPLRDMVVASTPEIDEPDFKVFACDKIPNFQFEKIIHLALGLFWKSAAHTWNVIDGPAPRIELGPYEEPIRQFVHGTGPFPKNVCLGTFLDTSTPPLIAVTPPRRFQLEGAHLFIFYMNGLHCSLCVGKRAGALFGGACMASRAGHPIFLVPDAGESMLAVLQKSVKGSRPSRRLLKTIEQAKIRKKKTER